MPDARRVFLPLGIGSAGMFFLAGLYIGIMSWVEGFRIARDLFWSDRWIVIPLIIGFGIQIALYTILKFRLFLRKASPGTSDVFMGASGTTSSVALIACCAHHVTDVLPIVGLTAAATFLSRFRPAFLWIGLGMTLIGILVMLVILIKERRKAKQLASHIPAVETL